MLHRARIGPPKIPLAQSPPHLHNGAVPTTAGVTIVRGVRTALLGGALFLGAGSLSPAAADVMAAEPAQYRAPVLAVEPPRDGMPTDALQSAHCAMFGTGASVVALHAGAENLVNLIAGGLVPPANRAALYIGIVGVVFASFCQIGQAFTPLYLYLVDPPPPPDPGRPVRAASLRVEETVLPAVDELLDRARRVPGLLTRMIPGESQPGGSVAGVSGLAAALR